MMGVGVRRWSEYSEALLPLVSFHETRRDRGKERHIRTLTLPKHEPSIPSSPIRGSQRTTHAPSYPSYSPESQLHAISPCPWLTKRRRGSPRNADILAGASGPSGPHTACPTCGGWGEGEAELEEGGCDLERERDAGEGVRRIMWG